MLDLIAAGEHRRFDAFRAVRVDHRSQPLRFRFATDRLELLVAQRLCSAVANARRREDLDDVRTFRLTLAHLRAQ